MRIFKNLLNAVQTEYGFCVAKRRNEGRKNQKRLRSLDFSLSEAYNRSERRERGSPVGFQELRVVRAPYSYTHQAKESIPL